MKSGKGLIIQPNSKKPDVVDHSVSTTDEEVSSSSDGDSTPPQIFRNLLEIIAGTLPHPRPSKKITLRTLSKVRAKSTPPYYESPANFSEDELEHKSINDSDNNDPIIYVIGGGIAGCSTALKLADSDHKVVILEANSDILLGSSDGTPCRISLGFHYSDEATAIKLLETSIDLVRHYPGYKITDRTSNKDQAHLGRGRYFVTKDSLFKPEEVEKIYKKLQGRYSELVRQDRKNKVFGDPKNFFRKLDLAEYKDVANVDNIALAFETAETFLDWPKLKSTIVEKIKNHKNINLHTHTEVIDAKPYDKDERYALTVKNKELGSTELYKADIVVNASWQNIEAINDKVGIGMHQNSRTNRTKVMIEVRLPDSLKNSNSMFFCFGPFCSFTNLGDGRGFITYEPVTNIEQSTSLHVPELSARLLSGGATDQEKRDYGRRIIEGVAQFIPDMAHAEYVNAKFGNVLTKGEVNISARDSKFHQRLEDGVEDKMLGWIDNASMKLIRFMRNGVKASDLIGRHLAALNALPNITNKMVSFYATIARNKINTVTITQMLKKHIQRATVASDQIEYAAGEEKLINNWRPVLENKNDVSNEFMDKLKQQSIAQEEKVADAETIGRAALNAAEFKKVKFAFKLKSITSTSQLVVTDLFKEEKHQEKTTNIENKNQQTISAQPPAELYLDLTQLTTATRFSN